MQGILLWPRLITLVPPKRNTLFGGKSATEERGGKGSGSFDGSRTPEYGSSDRGRDDTSAEFSASCGFQIMKALIASTTNTAKYETQIQIRLLGFTAAHKAGKGPAAKPQSDNQ
jgi:hypothetical protein